MGDGFELTLHGLLRKRAEMARDVTALRDALADKLIALDHLDSTIRIFNPAIDLCDMPERPPTPFATGFRGELQRFLLSTLRNAPEPFDTLELATTVMEARRLDTGDRILFKLTAGRVGHCLARLRAKGWVRSDKASKGALLRWTATARVGEPVPEWRNGSETHLDVGVVTIGSTQQVDSG